MAKSDTAKTLRKNIRGRICGASREVIAAYGWDAFEMALDLTEHPVPKKEKELSELDWAGKCEVCGASPIVPETGMCGFCTFGDADTVDGDW